MQLSQRMCRMVAGTIAGVVAGLVAMPSGAQAQSQGQIEGFVGYYFAEELDANISYGLRGAWSPSKGWGIMGSYERYEKNDGKGYGRPGNVDAQIQSIEASYVARPWGEGFEIFSGLGLTDIDVDAHVNNPAVDLTKSTLSLHVGAGYRAMLGENLYLRPEARARIYDAGNSTVDISASIALGWSWDND